MIREGWTFSKVTDPEALAWDDHRYWQSLSVGERLRISFELSEMAYSCKVTQAAGGRERLQRPSDTPQ